ncbi:MAG: FAD:protein FMN transferase [Burkholderiaceae bacterium]|nr:FAD:protein FMN transferase [Burkholderiaceae bacterium]
MTTVTAAQQWKRRARPLLGTLVEVGIRSDSDDWHLNFEAAFAAVQEVQRCLSRFDPDSDLSRFHALRSGQVMTMRPATKAVLAAAATLQVVSNGLFDISLGTAPFGWRCEDDVLLKLDMSTRLDAGGIAKGYAVDVAVQELMRRGCTAGWINAGGDLRVFGDIDLPVHVRDESTGGVRRFADLRDGAFATSHFDASSRSRLVRGQPSPLLQIHVSVAAPQCMWADALTKVVAIHGDIDDPILSRFQARAWQH